MAVLSCKFLFCTVSLLNHCKGCLPCEGSVGVGAGVNNCGAAPRSTESTAGLSIFLVAVASFNPSFKSDKLRLLFRRPERVVTLSVVSIFPSGFEPAADLFMCRIFLLVNFVFLVLMAFEFLSFYFS